MHAFRIQKNSRHPKHRLNAWPVALGWLLGLLLIAGCHHHAVPSDGQTFAITDQIWRLVELEGEAIEVPFARQPTLELATRDGRPARGFGGCNRFSGNYLLVGNTLRLSQLAGTRMACPDLKLEQQYLTMLNKANRYTTPDSLTLVLYQGEETLAVFKR